jgi:membrane fusion protein (multidrug efflux system)
MDGSQFAMRSRAPTPQNHAPTELQVEALAPKGEDHHVEHADDERRDEPRRGILRRHPFAFLGSLILLFVALPAGYVYWDYASHFESTDDAFIAARLFTIAPKVPGYLTAVPVTDNEHLAAGR